MGRKWILVDFPEPIPDTIGLDSYNKGRPEFLLQRHFWFYVNGQTHLIPKDFLFDFASVPRGLWNIFPPYDPKYAAASLIHDWLYAGEYYPRALSDDCFRSAMAECGVPVWKRDAMYIAVRSCGWITYRKHTFESVMKVRKLSDITNEMRPMSREPRNFLCH